MTSYKMRKMNGENWQPPRQLFCEKCGTGFKDSDPLSLHGEFCHPANCFLRPEGKTCENQGKTFYMTKDGMDVNDEAKKAKIKIFVRKRWRKFQ